MVEDRFYLLKFIEKHPTGLSKFLSMKRPLVNTNPLSACGERLMVVN